MTTYTSQPDEASANDTYIYQLAATTNYGTDAYLRVGKNSGQTNKSQRTLIKFDLSSIHASAISSAVLSLTINNEWVDNSYSMYAYRILKNWVEGEVTWNIYSTGNNWATAGCGGSGTDYNATSLGDTGALGTAPSGTKTISLNTTEILKMVDGTYSNYGFMLYLEVGASINDGIAFNSSSNATESNRPKLVIEYTELTFSISGNAGIAGATMSYNDGGAKTVTSGSNGAYTISGLTYNWSGTVTPSKTGYTFSPTSKSYTNLVANDTGEDYTATAITYTISGNAGVAGASLAYTDGTAKSATADGSGAYSFTVSYNWSGSVTPSKAGYTFSPTSKSYTNVLANDSGEDYTATALGSRMRCAIIS